MGRRKKLYNAYNKQIKLLKSRRDGLFDMDMILLIAVIDEKLLRVDKIFNERILIATKLHQDNIKLLK